MIHQMYEPDFPSNFPSAGVWEIVYFDAYKEGHPLLTSNVFINEHMGQYQLLRNRSKYGWDYRIGEDNRYLMSCDDTNRDSPYYPGQWRFYTWMSVIYLVKARFLASNASEINGVL